MTLPSDSPLSRLESQFWRLGIIAALLSATGHWLLPSRSQYPLLHHAVPIVLILGLTAVFVSKIRRVVHHSLRLNDEASSLLTRYVRWQNWLTHQARTSNAAPSLSVPSLSMPESTNQHWLDAQQVMQFVSINDRLEAEVKELERSLEELVTVLTSLEMGVMVLDHNNRISLINRAAQRLLHIDRPCLYQPLLQFVRVPDLIQAIDQVVARQIDTQTRFDLADLEGERRHLCVHCLPLAGGTHGVLMTIIDETERKLNEETRRDFIANVSHELKTPLAAIKGYAETIQLAIDDDPDAAKHFLNQINDQCKRLESLIADMMTLARAQAGQRHLRPATLTLQSVIDESLASYTPVAAARQIRLTYVPPTQPVTVYADREATLTIANNLIGNALRYTPEGGAVSVEVRQEGTWGVLKVQDNGIGIPETEHKRIFERFYRVDRTRRTAGGGTGLGLAIVDSLTRAQAGQIRLKSRVGIGSTFEILLPNSAE